MPHVEQDPYSQRGDWHSEDTTMNIGRNVPRPSEYATGLTIIFENDGIEVIANSSGEIIVTAKKLTFLEFI